MKLIEARIFKFNDFLTDGSLDIRKLNKVRRVLAKRVDSTAESYKLAASARGYAPSGVAFPIEGLNNIVAGVRKVPGSKYVSMSHVPVPRPALHLGRRFRIAW